MGRNTFNVEVLIHVMFKFISISRSFFPLSSSLYIFFMFTVLIFLQGALLLTEVMKERDAQIEIKKGKQNWEKEREEYLHQLEQRVILVLA